MVYVMVCNGNIELVTKSYDELVAVMNDVYGFVYAMMYPDVPFQESFNFKDDKFCICGKQVD